MTSFLSSKLVWLLASQTALLALVIISVLWLGESRSSYADACRNQIRCNRLSDEILQMRKIQSVAEEKKTDDGFGNRQLIQYATKCSILESQVASIDRLPPSKIERTDYQRQDTSVDLRAITLPKLIKLAMHIEQNRPTMKVTAISLVSASGRRGKRGAEDKISDELWNANLILTRLEFVAKRELRSGG